MKLTDPKQDEQIRVALKLAQADGQLQVVSAVSGVSIKTLKAIAKGEAIDQTTRALLALHLP